MLSLVERREATYNNRAFISKSAAMTHLKLIYYRLFAQLYGMVGRNAHSAMCNSSWTAAHIQDIWGVRAAVVWPPCNTDKLQKLHLEGRQRVVVSLGQFRPEKNHALQVCVHTCVRACMRAFFFRVSRDEITFEEALLKVRERLGVSFWVFRSEEFHALQVRLCMCACCVCDFVVIIVCVLYCDCHKCQKVLLKRSPSVVLSGILHLRRMCVLCKCVPLGLSATGKQ